MLLGKVKQGGTFGSVLGPPANAALHPTVKVVAIGAQPDPRKLEEMADAVLKGGLAVPVTRTLPLADAGEGQADAEKAVQVKLCWWPEGKNLSAETQKRGGGYRARPGLSCLLCGRFSALSCQGLRLS